MNEHIPTLAAAMKVFLKAFEQDRSIQAFNDGYDAVDLGGEPDGWPELMLLSTYDNSVFIQFFWEVRMDDDEDDVEMTAFLRIEADGTIVELEELPPLADRVIDVTDLIPDINDVVFD
jgi:hypothetical protein